MVRLFLFEAGIVMIDGIKSIRFDKQTMLDEFMNVINGEYDLSFLKDVKEDIYANHQSIVDKAREYRLNAHLMKSDEILEAQYNKIEMMINSHLVNTKEEAIELIREFAIKLSELKIREASTRRDLHIIQAINALDEYDKFINILSERIREWYGLHFPELSSMIENINTYTDIVLIGKRDELTLESLNNEKASQIIDAAKSSKGGDVTANSINVMKVIAKELKALIRARDIIVRYLEDEMEETAPNVKELVGANIGARLIAKAGGLDRLATLPASTIQVLGAEKALFRALKTRSKPPKHGILFQHVLVHTSPLWQRGKIARTLASNIALAARIDLYKGIKDPELLKRLERRIEEIRERYKEMPKKIEEKPKKEYKRKWRKHDKKRR